MAKTKEDYKQMLEKLKSRKGGGNFDFLELTDGKNIVRVLPGHPNMEQFFVQVLQHGKKVDGKYMSVICLNHDDPRATECLIDSEELEELRTSKDAADKKLYKEYRAKPRFYLNVVSRKDGKVWPLACGQQILTGILEIVTDEEYGDVLDPMEGRDLIIVKSGEGMETEYIVKPKVSTSPIFEDEDEVTKLIGTSAEDTQLPDLTELTKQFEGEPEKALQVWRQGWKSLEDGGEEKPKGTAGKKTATSTGSKPKPAAAVEEDEVEVKLVPMTSRCSTCGDKRFKYPDGKIMCKNKHMVAKLEDGQAPSKPSKAYLAEFPPAEPEPAEEPPKPMKSRCAVCGDKRFKYADGTVSCEAGHGGKQLAEDARPTKPSKAYLAEFPEPVEEEAEEVEEEEVEEASAPKPKPGAGAKTPTATAKPKPGPAAEEEDEEGLDDLDQILAAHSKKK